jgi:multicomponent Na+:H+ antiporter subunit B
MKSTILSTGVTMLLPLFVFFSLFMLFRGHDQPGGGFIAGLLGASGFIFYGLAYDMKKAERLLVIDTAHLISFGMLLAFISGLYGLFVHQAYMQAYWPAFSLPLIGTPGTPIIFDIGVYMVVVGTILKICFVLDDKLDNI